MKNMLLITALLLGLTPISNALEASASMGNIRKGVADNAKIEALTTIVEALGSDLQQTKANLQAAQDKISAMENCATQNKIYTPSGCKSINANVESITVRSHSYVSPQCPTGYKVISCSSLHADDAAFPEKKRL